MFDEKMEEMRNKVKGEFVESKEAREFGMYSVKEMLKGISDLCDKNMENITKSDPKLYLRINTLQFVSMLINIYSVAETASEMLDMILEGYKGSEKQEEKERTKEPETKESEIIGGHKQHPKCFGRYLENRKYCDYDDCPVRKICCEEYRKYNE